MLASGADKRELRSASLVFGRARRLTTLALQAHVNRVSGKTRIDGTPISDPHHRTGRHQPQRRGPGGDCITGGAGRDALSGGEGSDQSMPPTVSATAWRCGNGRASVRADRRDVLRSCEVRLR